MCQRTLNIEKEAKRKRTAAPGPRIQEHPLDRAVLASVHFAGKSGVGVAAAARAVTGGVWAPRLAFRAGKVASNAGIVVVVTVVIVLVWSELS